MGGGSGPPITISLILHVCFASRAGFAIFRGAESVHRNHKSYWKTFHSFFEEATRRLTVLCSTAPYSRATENVCSFEVLTHRHSSEVSSPIGADQT